MKRFLQNFLIIVGIIIALIILAGIFKFDILDQFTEHNLDNNKIKKNYSEPKNTKINKNNAWYQPAPEITWQWQLQGQINTNYNVNLYDLDLEKVSPQTIKALHDKGVKVICYFNAGAYEPYRKDAHKFPKTVLGKTMSSWPDEKWLDISNYEKFANIIKARLDLAVQKNCDGVEPDNIDAYQNDSGFELNFADQIKYNRWLAQEAHQRNLSIALKNDLDQIKELVNDFDFAINEQCFQYHECQQLLPFIENNKAVLNVEYELELPEFCSLSQKMKFSSLRMNYDLSGSRNSCDNK